VLLTVLFGLSAVAIVQWGGDPLPILEGQRAIRPYFARVTFTYLDPNEEKLLRFKAKESVPNYYREALDGLMFLNRQLRHLADKSSDEIGLLNWPYSDRGKTGKSKDAELHEIINGMGAEAYEGRVQKLHDIFRRRGVVRTKHYDQERFTRGRRDEIVIVRTTGKEEKAPTDQLLSPGLRSEINACVDEAFADWPADGQELLKELLLHELVPTLEFDPQLTEARREEAAAKERVDPRTYPAGYEILKAGDVATRDDIGLLKAEARKYNESQDPWSLLVRLGGMAVLVFSMTVLSVIYLAQFHSELLESLLEVFKLGVVCLLALAVGKGVVHGGPLLPLSPYLVPAYLIPLPFFASLITIAYSPRLARIIVFFLAIVLAIMMGNNFVLLVVLVFGSFVAIYLSHRIRDRSVPLRIGLGAGLSQALGSIGLTLLIPGRPVGVLSEVASGLVNGLLTGIALSVLLPLIEKLFNVVTDSKLLELADQNHPLLRQLALEAPGTYQHTLMAATLAEAGAEAIGANSLLTRVGCYYHDIGKVAKPQYFVENEDWRGSRHKDLNASISALIITSHTRDGIAMAQEHRLPKAIIDFIPQHHGTALVEYFYHKAQEKEGESPVDEARFRYPGPMPQSRETGIALLADTVEAACRTLDNPTSSRIRALVHDLLMKKLLDGQLEECPLTLRDLRGIEDSFTRSLTSFYHHRVKYPGSQQPAQKPAPDRSQPPAGPPR
jgi:putative nucleotidyltransferase with HDIG domain